MATSRLPSRGPKIGQSYNVTSVLSWFPRKGDKIRNGYIILAVAGAQDWMEVRCNPCVLRGPQKKGTESMVATSPLPLRGPKIGRKSYLTPPFSGVLKKGGQIRSGYNMHALLGAQDWYVNPIFSGVPTKGDKIRSDKITLAFSGAQDWAEELRDPCFLGGC